VSFPGKITAFLGKSHIDTILIKLLSEGKIPGN
jgi:hypothetical protein